MDVVQAHFIGCVLPACAWTSCCVLLVITQAETHTVVLLLQMSGTSIDGRTVVVNKVRSPSERAAHEAERGYRRDSRYPSDQRGHYDRHGPPPRGPPKVTGYRISITNLPDSFTWRWVCKRASVVLQPLLSREREGIQRALNQGGLPPSVSAPALLNDAILFSLTPSVCAVPTQLYPIRADTCPVLACMQGAEGPPARRHRLQPHLC